MEMRDDDCPNCGSGPVDLELYGYKSLDDERSTFFVVCRDCGPGLGTRLLPCPPCNTPETLPELPEIVTPGLLLVLASLFGTMAR
jgi:hypothetical protein